MFLSTFMLTHSWSWALLEKLPIVQSFKKFSAFLWNPRFITVFTRALHRSLSWARSMYFYANFSKVQASSIFLLVRFGTAEMVKSNTENQYSKIVFAIFGNRDPMRSVQCSFVKFFTAVIMKITVFWDVMTRNLVVGYWWYWGTCYLHLQGRSVFHPEDGGNT
jgi:hypothetical protein